MAHPRLPRMLAPLLLLVPLLVWGCSDGSDPSTAAGSRSIDVSFSIAGPFDGQPAASLAEAFDQADNLIVRVLIPGRDPIVETLHFDPGQDEIHARVSVPIPDGVTNATIIVELRRGDEVLFRAERNITLGTTGDFQLDLELEPAPGSIELGSPWTVTTLGAPVQLDGVVRFATGEEIPDATLVWSTEATGITITPDGVVTALANGTWTVRAESGDLAATGEVVVSAEAVVTSVLPSPVVLGQPTDLLIEGSSLQGATGVAVCGTAVVDPGLHVSADGTVVEVRVTWAIFDEAGESQKGDRCVRVTTPQGDAEGSVELVEPPAESIALSPSSANLAMGATVQLEAEVRDGNGNLLSDDQIVFSSDRPDVASVSEDGLVTAQAPGTAVVTATAGPATASATIVVGGGVVQGTVTSDGEPLAGITVTLTGSGDATVTTTDDDGVYGFQNVAPGTHTVSISDIPTAHRFATTARTVEVVSTETVTANFAGSAAPGTVSGTVTIDDSPAEGITLTLTGDGHFFLDITDAGGGYRFEAPAGTYVLAVAPLQGGVFDPAAYQIQITPGQDLVIDFAGIAASVDLEVSKSVDVTTAQVGDVVTFTVGVANLGTGPASGVSVDDPLPAGLTLSSASASAGSYDAGIGIWTVGGLDAGAQATLTLSATVDAGSGLQTITNTASVAGLDQADADPGNDEASASFTVQATVDIVVTKSVDVANPNVGDAVAYTVTATNNGPADATGLELTDALPAGLTFVSASATTGSYAQGTGVWTVGTLAAGATATLTLNATVDAGQGGSTLTNTATVTAVDQTETDPGDETASADVVVQQVELSVVKTADVTEAPEGSTFTYTVVVSNATGFDAATNVLLSDPVPAGLTYSTHTVSQGTYTSGTGAWTVGTLAAGATATLTLDVTVDGGTAGTTITSTATVTAADQEDADLAYPSGSVDVDVPATVDIVVTKSVDVANPNVGDAVAYTVTATNNGPADATGLAITDALPAGLTFVSASATTGSYAQGTGVWTVGTLAAGAPATLTLNATVDAGQGGSTLTNTATVTAVDQTETAPGDETSSVDVVVQQVDLSVVKTADVTEASEGSTFTYTVVVSNAAGFDAATNVLLSDPVPAGLTYSTHTVSQGTYTSGTGAWTVGTLAAGATATLTLDVTVDGGTAGTTITNTATVTAADQEDADLAYPSGSVDVDVVHNPVGRAYTTAGNTLLVAGATPPGPHAMAATNLLDGTPTLTAVAGTFATTNGGSVTIDTNGDFGYTPSPGDAGPDSFDYTVQTGESATVTVTITGMVWYVDQRATPGTGVSNDPFNAISSATAVTADSDGSTIYVHRGDGTSTGYMDTSLRVGQSLVGEGVALTVTGVGTLAPAGTAPVLSGGVESSAVTLNDGVSVKGVDVVAPGAGIGLAAFSLTGGVTVDHVNISGSGNTGVYISSSTGTYTFTNLDITGAPTVSAITVTGGSPTVSFGIAAGSISTTSGRLFQVMNTIGGSVTFTGGAMTQTGGDGVRINGNAGTVNVQNLVTITNPADTAVVVGNNTATVDLPNLDVTTNGWPGVRTVGNTATVTLGGDVDTTGETALSFLTSDHAASFNSVTVDNTGVPIRGISISSSTGTTSVTTLDVTTDGATGINLTGGGTFTTNNINSSIVTNGASAFVATPSTGFANDLLVGLGTLTVTSPTGSGVFLSDATGTFVALGGSISDVGPGGLSAGVAISGGSVNFNYGGSITNTLTPTARSVLVSGLAGTASFNGLITDTGAGISLTNNTGTVNFTGGLDLDATTASAFSATGGGTVTVTGAGNTVSTISGIGVEIDGTTIGLNDVTFESVSASTGATSAIRLNNTGTVGDFTVTGTGTPGSGGTISGTTGHAVHLAMAHSVTLSWMDISTSGGNALQATGSADVAVDNSSITNTSNTAVSFSEVTGSSAITNTTVIGSGSTQMIVNNSSGTLQLDLIGSSFTDPAAVVGTGFAINTTGTAIASILVDGVTFDGNTGSGFFGVAFNQSVLDVTVRNGSFFTGNSSQGFSLSARDDGTVTFDVSNSTFAGNGQTGVYVQAIGTGSSTATGSVDGNTLTDNGPDGFHITGGILAWTQDAGEAVVSVTNNLVTQTPDARGVTFVAGTGSTDTGRLDVHLDGNSVNNGATTTRDPIWLSTNGATTLCFALGTNSVTVGNGVGFQAHKFFASTVFDVEDLASFVDMADLIRTKTTFSIVGSGSDVGTSGSFTSVAPGTCLVP